MRRWPWQKARKMNAEALDPEDKYIMIIHVIDAKNCSAVMHDDFERPSRNTLGGWPILCVWSRFEAIYL